MADDKEEAQALAALRERGEKKTLAEIIPEIRAAALNLIRYTDPKLGHALLAPKSVLLQHQQLLEDQGIHSLAYLGHGSVAVVLSTGNHSVVRLAPTREARRPSIDEYLQPIYTIDKSGLRLEVLPQVDMANVAKQHLGRLALALLDKGYRFTDHAQGNVGLLDDGTPVVIDADATSKIPNYLLKAARPILEKMIRVQYGVGKDEAKYDFKLAQQKQRDLIQSNHSPATEQSETDSEHVEEDKWRNRDARYKPDSGLDDPSKVRR